MHEDGSSEANGHGVGAPPGTLRELPDSAKPRIRVLAFSEGALAEHELRDPDEVRTLLETWPVTWINVDGLGDTPLIQRLGDILGLHDLALEDVLNRHHRPKAETYEKHMFVVVRMLEPGEPVHTEQVSIFFGEGFVVTFQEHPGDCLEPLRERIRDGRGRVRRMGADYLAYCIIDAVVDAYFPFLDTLDETAEAIEQEVLARPEPVTLSRIHEVKRGLMTVRRVISPLRDAVNVLLRDTDVAVTDATRIYLRDCYDHAVQVLDTVEHHRELFNGFLDIYLSSVSNRMNEVMKVLTIIATLFIPLSFLAGIYGMNFDPGASPWNMPELKWYWGYPVFLLAAILIAGLELLLFWHAGWLGSTGRDRDKKR